MMRRALVEPIPEIFAAAAKLSQAVEAHRAGEQGLATELLRQADDPIIWAYTDYAWGGGAKQRFGFVSVEGAPPLLARSERLQPRMPTTATKKAVLARDGYHCRFCGIPVIQASIRQLLQRAYPDVVRWGGKNTDQHAAFQCMWLQFDHVLPNGRGGDSALENVVVTCAPCNFGRMETTLAEARLLDPRLSKLADTWEGFATWDGLERLRSL